MKPFTLELRLTLTVKSEDPNTSWETYDALEVPFDLEESVRSIDGRKQAVTFIGEKMLDLLVDSNRRRRRYLRLGRKHEYR